MPTSFPDQTTPAARPAHRRLLIWQGASVLLLLTLAALGFCMELWLTPLRPGGSWLVLKAVPLLLALPGLLHGRRYTFQWLSLFVWLYVMAGSVRALGLHRNEVLWGSIETLVALALFAACALYARASAPSRLARHTPPSAA